MLFQFLVDKETSVSNQNQNRRDFLKTSAAAVA
ncbi:MAG TPA: hypothetical protein DCM07_03085, partial [Planctomycetaceae bacterium]|nr:hypothetical protein [Planctomycetaceae bacterium]